MKHDAAPESVLSRKSRGVVDASKFRSKGRNTPYAGHTLYGRTHATLVGGRVAFRAGS